MPFGKYRGWLLRDLPHWYLGWIAALPNLRDPLKTAIEKEWQRRVEEGQSHDQRKDPVPAMCPDATACEMIIRAGVRSLARREHPDAGGDHMRMVMINISAEWLRTQVKRLVEA